MFGCHESQRKSEISNFVFVGGRFLLHSHMLSAGGVTLLDPDLSGELRLELNIGLHNPTASGVFLGLQNG